VKLVFVTQEVDPRHPVLAQTVDLVRSLAARVDALALVARRVDTDVPANATARTFDASTRIGRSLAFERALLGSLGGADGVLVHMVPEFAVLAAPAARVRRIPLVLWYTHWNAGRALRIATPLVDRILSVDRSSFPLSTPKVRGIGHAIDVARFEGTPARAHDGPVRLLAIGRTARWKGLGTLLDALDRTASNVSLEIRGPSLTDDERSHREELQQRIAQAQLPAQLLPAVPREDIPALLSSADVVVSPNEPHTGSTLDKAVFEAAACARPVLSTNASFVSLLGGVALPLIAPPRDPQALAAAIDAIALAGASARAAAGAELRRRVVAHHSLDHWADEVLAAISEVRSPRGEAGPPR